MNCESSSLRSSGTSERPVPLDGSVVVGAVATGQPCAPGDGTAPGRAVGDSRGVRGVKRGPAAPPRLVTDQFHSMPGMRASARWQSLEWVASGTTPRA